MGTRNLTAVMSDGKYKLAQYGQWDGYPERCGLIALKFARSIANDLSRGAFKKALDRVRFVGEDEYKKMLETVGVGPGVKYMTMEQSDVFGRKYPHLSRDWGAKILDVVANATDDVLTSDNIAFAGDSLMCEWAYVIDLDRGTFETYKGFNQEPHSGERFSEAPITSSGYHAIKHEITFKLDELPTDEVFLAAFGEDEGDT